MYGKVWSLFACAWSYLTGKAAAVCMFGVLAFNGLCVAVFAQQGTEILIEDSGIDWTGLPAKIMGSLITPVVVGIGIALSIWVILAGVRFFRRTAA